MNLGGIQTNMYNISRSMIANGIRLFGYVLIEKLLYEGYRDIINKKRLTLFI